MKTIADYQPHPLISGALDALRSNTRTREPDFHALLVLAWQVGYDMNGQGIQADPGDGVAWVRRTLADA